MMSKSLVIEPIPGTTMVQIKFEGGGELPEALKGAWTNRSLAHKAIDVWRSDKKDRNVEVKDQRVEDEKVLMERLGK